MSRKAKKRTPQTRPPARIGRPWVDWLLLTVALVFRLTALNIKPAHFDEGINGYFVDQITRLGFFHYDPSNFHGPLHFYILFVAQTLLGRHEWVLRLPTALASAGCVFLTLKSAPFLGKTAARLAALLIAISPAMVFYGRYAIHESWMLFFLMLVFLGLAGMATRHRPADLWMVALGFTGMLLTKETYIIHAVVVVATATTISIQNRLCPLCPWHPLRSLLMGNSQPTAQNSIFGTWVGGWTNNQLQTVAVTCGLLVLFFYSGGFMDPASLSGIWETFGHWFTTGTGGESGQEKPWYYWLQLLARYEWPTLAGLLLSPFLLWPRTDRFVRFLAIAGLGTFTAFTLIAYKTPWCIICIQWPFLLLAGWGLSKMLEPQAPGRPSRTATRLAAVTLLLAFGGHSLWRTVTLNFQRFTDENEPYVYVQTHLDINRLLDPLKTLAAADPRNFHIPGYILTADKYPMVWQLADFTKVTFANPDPQLGIAAADFLLIDIQNQSEIESELHAPYFREEIQLRGSYPNACLLYFRQERFASLFPGRQAEFQPTSASTGVPP